MRSTGALVWARFAALILFIPACKSTATTQSFSATPIIENPSGFYQEGTKSFPLGLYLGTNRLSEASHAHDRRARDAAAMTIPLCHDGHAPASTCSEGGEGRIGVVAIGFSNWHEEICGAAAPDFGVPAHKCGAGSFMQRVDVGLAATPPTASPYVTVVDCAQSRNATRRWALGRATPLWAQCNDQLQAAGLTPNQVEVVLFKTADGFPITSHTLGRLARPLCGSGDIPNVDACENEQGNGAVARFVKSEWRNTHLMFLHSRIYAGYARDPLNPEPFAYEYGFAVRFTIFAQIRQANNGEPADEVAGDLSYARAPVLLWGSYFWADGKHANSDGITWEQADFRRDGTHPSRSGIIKVGKILFDFFDGVSAQGRNALPYTVWFRPSEALSAPR